RTMKRAWVEWTWVGGVLLFLGAATASAASSVPRFDGRGWTIGNQQKNAKESLTEYVLPGQTVDGWQELGTSTVFFQPVPLGAFVDRIHSSIAHWCPSLVWNVIGRTRRQRSSSGTTRGAEASSRRAR